MHGISGTMSPRLSSHFSQAFVTAVNSPTQEQSSDGVCGAVGRGLAWHTQSPVPSPGLHKPSEVAHACDLSPWEVKTGGSEVQSNPWSLKTV